MSDKTFEVWLGEAKQVWCDECALPSKLVYPIYVPTQDGMHEPGMYTECEGCADTDG